MPLTDMAVRSAKPKDKPYKLSDAGGLYLAVETNGSRLWRVAYRFDRKQKLLSLGAYPAVTLADARAGRDQVKALLAKGVDPSAQRKLDRGAARDARACTFRVVGDELVSKFEAEGLHELTLDKKRWMLRVLNGDIGDRPIADVRAGELLEALRRFERRGHHESARRARALAAAVFRFAIATGRAERNPAADLMGALITPTVAHRPAITEPKAVGALLRAIDGLDGQIAIRAALQLLALTFVRPGELRHAEWKEFDLDGAVWIIPAEKMKMDRQHKVPLSKQSIALIRGLRDITGSSPHLFPQVRSWHRPISDGTLNASLRRLGYDKTQMVSHGFRGLASTLLNESRLWHPDVIERQLAHEKKDDVRAAYNSAQHWDERVRMMQWWANHLDDLRRSGSVVSIAKARRSRSAS
ncbi:tyrosine-type recombinase/integrase [Bradyrhizobium sp. 2S1]|uniref:tyrosine-type recombinase/integrase n=1 Tax=Bradyrhizobium sp. 2S1 TaxID=1404429 RepID=UPI001409D27E|nr:integrase arm-type DNA-binding domain-containing protein [Bradyrhizobium sp. 2S1]MCK7665263.1 integrase arm-type DNA-binding domain-containing protein [Bradyrhizobium sp. 2S1]